MESVIRAVTRDHADVHAEERNYVDVLNLFCIWKPCRGPWSVLQPETMSRSVVCVAAVDKDASFAVALVTADS